MILIQLKKSPDVLSSSATVKRLHRCQEVMRSNPGEGAVTRLRSLRAKLARALREGGVAYSLSHCRAEREARRGVSVVVLAIRMHGFGGGASKEL